MRFKRKRLVVTLSVIVSLVVLVAWVLPNIRYTVAGRGCPKCYLRGSYKNVSVFGYSIYRKENYPYKGTPQLKAKQRSCQHLWSASGQSRYLLFRAEEFFSGHRCSGYGWARWAEGGLINIVVAELEELPEAMNRAEWAWFMQQATGQDFGVRFDDDAWEPIIEPDSIERVLTWWEAEGKANFDKGE